MRILRIFLFLLFFEYIAFANDNFTEAFRYFNSGNYHKSFDIFDKYQLENLTNEKYNYYYALSAYKIKKYKIALGVYERIIMNNPNYQYARLGLGMTELKLFMYEDAKNEFEALLSNPVTYDNIKNSARIYLKKTNIAMKKSDFKLTVGVGIYHDSNVNQAPVDEQVNIPALNIDVETQKSKSDSYHQDMINLYSRFNLFDRSNWYLSNNAFIHNTGYRKAKEQDLVNIGIAPTLNYSTDDYDFSFLVQGMNVRRGDKKYLNIFYVKPTVSFDIAQSLKVTLGVSNLQKNYAKEYKGYSSSTFEGDIKLAHFLFGNYVFWNLAIGNERSKNDLRIDVDNHYENLGLDLYFPVFNKAFIRLKNDYQAKHYSNYNAFFQNKRKDDIYKFSLAFMYNFTEDWLGEIGYTYKFNHSNQDLYNYKEQIFGFNIYKTFDF